MPLYRNKYRIESARCPNWDYTSNGAYFITICTKNRQCFFGDVVGGEMRLSEIGAIVADEWQKTLIVRPTVQLDAWIIMPNHIHGIIVIAQNLTPPVAPTPPVETFRRNVSTPTSSVPQPSPRLQSNSIGAIVGQFKSICTKRIWAAGFTDFSWQTRFHDHIIRDEEAAQRIRTYIINNPKQWNADKHHPRSYHVGDRRSRKKS